MVNESALIFQYFDVSLVVVSLDNISKQFYNMEGTRNCENHKSWGNQVITIFNVFIARNRGKKSHLYMDRNE